MKKKLRTSLAHTIIELKIASKDMGGVLSVMKHFQIKNLNNDLWNNIVMQIKEEDIIKELAQQEEGLQQELIDSLKESLDLKNLVLFSQAFDLLDQEAIVKVAEMHTNNFTQKSGKALLFSAKSLHDIMKDDSLRWARRAKIIALSIRDPEVFLTAVDFLNETAKEEDVLHLLEHSLKTLMEQDKERTACRFVLPECKKCLALLKRLPEEEGKRLEEIIFKR